MEQLPGAILLTLICVLVAIAVGCIGVRFNNRTVKQVAVMIGLAPVLGVGINLSASWFGWNNPAAFRDAAAGPARVQESVTRSAPFPVTNVEVGHQLELTPKIRGGDPPTGPVRLRFKVRSPKSDILAEGEQELTPARGLRWSTLRATFQPRELGEHTLDLQIPNPVGTVDIVVRELR